MVNNRFLGSIANAIDSAAVGTYLAKRAGGPVFEPLNYGDLADYPAVGIDSAGVLSLIDSSYLSARSSNLGTDIDSEVSTSGINNLIPDSSGVRSIGNYSKGISNIFLDSSSEIKIGSHSISISNEYILFDGGNAASFPAASGGSSGIAWGGERGIIGGGLNSDVVRTNVIQYITIASPGNATDFGDLTVGRQELGAVSNSTRAVFGGGDDGTGSSGILDTMDYVTTATTGNATDFGDLAGVRQGIAGCGDGTYGLFGGGDNYNYKQNRIHLITVASTGNASDFGDLSIARTKVAAVNDATYGVWAGGDTGSITNVIDYLTMATTGNATDFGDLGAALENVAGVGDATRGCFGGGNTSGRVNTIEYITIASPGNATDFGDLSETKTGMGSTGCSDGTYGTFQGGYNGSIRVNTIEYITVQTTGNVTDFGDLTIGGQVHAGCSGNAS